MSSDREQSRFSSILVAVDGSAHAETAVEYGAWLAASLGASVTVMHVIDARRLAGHFIKHLSEIIGGDHSEGLLARVREYYRAHGQKALERTQAICERYGVECQTELETGNVVQILAARGANADLLVMGQHGEDKERETGFLGSVAEKVVRKVERPLLLAQPPFREFRRALLAYDGSAAARRAMRQLARLAVMLKMEVDAVELVEWNEQTEALMEVSRYFKDFPVHLTTHYLTGDSLSVILNHAQEKKCDLLAMGAYADQTAESLGLGSTTEYLMRASFVPILVHH
ncbi:MAG TPA: universal stress protein [Pyrinomonadaceae bacterium]|jgi:nucleotide-binding universal stress UspA family protein|nr:universal stress protein [Pyrinomonadaceae bacterium]